VTAAGQVAKPGAGTFALMKGLRAHGRPGPPGQPRTGGFFATTVPGLGKLLLAEIAENPALEPEHEVSFDGRADIVVFRQRRGAQFSLDEMRLSEDVFARIGESRAGPSARVAAETITRAGLEHALSTRARFSRPLRAAMTFRAVTRVVDESRFKRTELRDSVIRAIAANRPRWRTADPADIEIWVLEHHRAHFISGVRLSDKRMRQRGEGRARERHAALRPAVAAAMVRLAGAPPGRLLDPCCGTGTIVAEALAAGWEASGSDIEPRAVAMARANVPNAAIKEADALHLPHQDAEFDAVVSNVPFGRQFRVDAGPARWLSGFLREAARVTRPGGRVVVLAPPPAPAGPAGLKLIDAHPIRLLGVPARIWVYERDNAPAYSRASMAAASRSRSM